jgi:hypothetical protein
MFVNLGMKRPAYVTNRYEITDAVIQSVCTIRWFQSLYLIWRILLCNSANKISLWPHVGDYSLGSVISLERSDSSKT